MVGRPRDGSTWRIGTDAEVAWIADSTPTGLTITAAIPPVFEAYATVLLPDRGDGQDQHDRAVLGLLNGQSAGQPWWLGYLDTGSDDIVFPDAPMVIFQENGREPGTRTIEGAALCGIRTEDREMRIPLRAREYERTCADCGHAWRVPRWAAHPHMQGLPMGRNPWRAGMADAANAVIATNGVQARRWGGSARRVTSRMNDFGGCQTLRSSNDHA